MSFWAAAAADSGLSSLYSMNNFNVVLFLSHLKAPGLINLGRQELRGLAAGIPNRGFGAGKLGVHPEADLRGLRGGEEQSRPEPQ